MVLEEPTLPPFMDIILPKAGLTVQLLVQAVEEKASATFRTTRDSSGFTR